MIHHCLLELGKSSDASRNQVPRKKMNVCHCCSSYITPNLLSFFSLSKRFTFTFHLIHSVPYHHNNCWNFHFLPSNLRSFDKGIAKVYILSMYDSSPCQTQWCRWEGTSTSRGPCDSLERWRGCKNVSIQENISFFLFNKTKECFFRENVSISTKILWLPPARWVGRWVKCSLSPSPTNRGHLNSHRCFKLILRAQLFSP